MVNAGWFCIGSAANMTGRGLVLACSTVGLLCSNNSMVNLARFRIDSCDSTAISTPNNMHNGFTLHEGTIQNTTGYGITHDSRAPIVARNVRFVGNSITPFSGASYAANIQLFNCLIADTMATWVPPAVPAADRAVYSTKHNQVADAHLIQFFGGTIIAATDQRHTASGISWKFRPTDTLRGVDFPLRLSVAKLACAASVAVSVTIWTRRDSTNINGILRLVGGQIAGVPIDVTVTCAPSINTWTQSSALTFTPTEAGVVEFTFEVYDGVGTSNNFWIDDLAVS
jgi:hypothetical protein